MVWFLGPCRRDGLVWLLSGWNRQQLRSEEDRGSHTLTSGSGPSFLLFAELRWIRGSTARNAAMGGIHKRLGARSTAEKRCTPAICRQSASLGVALEHGKKSEKSRASSKSSYRNLPQKFRKYPYLWLFLERAETSSEEARRAVLLGVVTPDALDRGTRVVQQNPQKPCQVDFHIGACVFFSDSGVRWRSQNER